MDAQLIGSVRERTGAGMLAVKKALDEAGGDAEKAIEILRTSGVVKAAKKAGRETGQGAVGSYIHSNGNVGVLVELQCETDFVARNDTFKKLLADVAMHIAALSPLYISREDVPLEVTTKEKSIYTEEVVGKPPEIATKIIEGKLNKYFKDNCLLEQDFVKNEQQTVEDVIKEKISLLGENIKVARFCRFAMNSHTQVCG